MFICFCLGGDLFYKVYSDPQNLFILNPNQPQGRIEFLSPVKLGHKQQRLHCNLNLPLAPSSSASASPSASALLNRTTQASYIGPVSSSSNTMTSTPAPPPPPPPSTRITPSRSSSTATRRSSRKSPRLNKFLCPKCPNKSYQTYSSLLRHQRVECHKEPQHVCELCSLPFYYLTTLRKHTERMHK